MPAAGVARLYDVTRAYITSLVVDGVPAPGDPGGRRPSTTPEIRKAIIADVMTGLMKDKDVAKKHGVGPSVVFSLKEKYGLVKRRNYARPRGTASHHAITSKTTILSGDGDAFYRAWMPNPARCVGRLPEMAPDSCLRAPTREELMSGRARTRRVIA